LILLKVFAEVKSGCILKGYCKVLTGIKMCIALAAGVGVIIILLYWLLVITEGTYLGQRVVTWLYDFTAGKYDSIKSFDSNMEAAFLGKPLAATLSRKPGSLVLDIATGTGRLPLTLLEEPSFQGRIVGVDHSRRMIRLAARKLQPFGSRAMFLWLDAMHLPFLSSSFDAVTALEMLEFTPNPREFIAEAIRVLRPGGVLLTTRRTGFEASLIPGKTFGYTEFAHLLKESGLSKVTIERWQIDYDLVWGVRDGDASPGPVHPLEVLLCKHCGQADWRTTEHALRCESCATSYPIRDGVIEMIK